MSECAICVYAAEHGCWPPAPQRDTPPGALTHRGTHCKRCHRSWTGRAEEHCSDCHRHFSGSTSGDRHRRDDEGTGVCLDLDDPTVAEKVGLVAVERDSGVVWVCAGSRPLAGASSR